MKVLYIIFFIPCLLFGQTKYFLPVPVESSEGRPIKNATVELYIANTDTLQQTLTWLDAGWYYYYGGNDSVPFGSYDVYVNDVIWRTNIAVGQADNNFVVSVLSDTASTLRTQWRSDINDSLATIYSPDGVTINGSKEAGLVVDGAYLAGNGLGSNVGEQLHVKVDDGLEINADSVRVKTDGITGSMILDGTISGADIGLGAVASEEILNGSIVNADLALNSITSSNIVSETILSSDIASESVGTSEIATGAVGVSDINSSLRSVIINYPAPSVLLDSADTFDGKSTYLSLQCTSNDTLYMGIPVPYHQMGTYIVLDSILFRTYGEGGEKITFLRIYSSNYGTETSFFSNETDQNIAGATVVRYQIATAMLEDRALAMKIGVSRDVNLYFYTVTYKYYSY